MSADKSEPVTSKLCAVEAIFSQVLNALKDPEVVIVGVPIVIVNELVFWHKLASVTERCTYHHNLL